MPLDHTRQRLHERRLNLAESVGIEQAVAKMQAGGLSTLTTTLAAAPIHLVTVTEADSIPSTMPGLDTQGLSCPQRTCILWHQVSPTTTCSFLIISHPASKELKSKDSPLSHPTKATSCPQPTPEKYCCPVAPQKALMGPWFSRLAVLQNYLESWALPQGTF